VRPCSFFKDSRLRRPEKWRQVLQVVQNARAWKKINYACVVAGTAFCTAFGAYLAKAVCSSLLPTTPGSPGGLNPSEYMYGPNSKIPVGSILRIVENQAINPTDDSGFTANESIR